MKDGKVPPDGGYGWVVVLAYALNNVVVLPLISGFALVFQEAFADTGLSHTQGTTVITLNYGIGMLLSFFGGPVLKRFGYRKVAVVGAIFIAAGLMITAMGSSFWVFILSYSIISSMGIAAVMAAFTLAINSYFREKRTRAVGAGMSVTGLGAIFMPLLMSALMEAYGWRYAVLTLGAICLHSLLAAFMLRPVKWYLIDPPTLLEEMVPLNKDGNIELVNGTLSKENGIPRLEAPPEIDAATAKSISLKSLSSTNSLDKRNSISHPDIRRKSPEPPKESKFKWWASQEINLGSSVNIFRESEFGKKEEATKAEVEVKSKEKKSFGSKIVAFFDLTLLTDAVFVNILFGMSIASCAETNFSLLLPIILNDMMKFQTDEIAKLMALIGLSDTMSRFVSPYIGEWCSLPPRIMYIFSLLLAIFIRSMMLFTSSFLGMVFVVMAMGFTKGVRTVYLNVIIPNHVPIERLPYASGIQMLVNGIIIITLGTALGKIRERSGSYELPITVLNLVTVITVVLWTVEFTYAKMKTRRTKEETPDA